MVKQLLHQGRSFLFTRQTSILSAAAVIAATYLTSALLGLVRDRLLAGMFSPHALGIYLAADRIPSFIFNLVVIGALSSSFIPVFTTYLSRREEAEAWKAASVIINLTLLIFASFSLVVIVTSGSIANLMAPPSATVADTNLLAALIRLMFLAQIFLLLSNFLTGLLQSYQRFLIPALAPIAYNFGVILGILFLSPTLGLYGPVWGAVIGAVLHFLIQVPMVRFLGIRYRLSFDCRHPGVAEMIRLAVPRLFGLAANQVTALVDTVLAASISFSAVTFFTFAQHLQNLPVSLFGAAIAQAALPALSLEAAPERRSQFKGIFLSALHQMAFLIFPAAAAIFVLRLPIVRLIFGASQYHWLATLDTGRVVAFFSLSLFAQAAVFLISRGFFALHESALPAKISLLTVAVNVVFSVIFVKWLHLDVWSLSLAFSFSAFLNFFLLLYYFDRRVGSFNRRQLLLPFIKIILATVFMSLAMFLVLKGLDRGAWGQNLNLGFFPAVSLDILILDTQYTINLIILTVLSGTAGLLTYFLSAWRLGLSEVEIVTVSFRRTLALFSRTFRGTGVAEEPTPLP